MTRRRLIVAACVAVVALGAAWWLFSDRLTADERHFVGTWHPTSGSGQWLFGADRAGRYERSFRGSAPTDPAFPAASWSYNYPGTWIAQGGVITVDGESNSFRRAIRPALRFFGRRPIEAARFTLESIFENEMVVITPDGTREVWTRIRED
jgi:hypothetical protein